VAVTTDEANESAHTYSRAVGGQTLEVTLENWELID